MSKEFNCRKGENTFKRKFPSQSPLHIKTNEYYGRKIRNPEEAGSMDYAEMFTRDNEEGWPYDDER